MDRQRRRQDVQLLSGLKKTVLIMSGGQQAHGFKAIKEIYEQSFDEVTMQKITFDDLIMNHTDTSAFVTGKFVAETKPTSGDGRYLISCRTSLSLAKVGSEWKIIGEHSSLLPDVERVQIIDD